MGKRTKFFCANHAYHFGKYKGMLVRDVIEKDPEYVKWCMENLKQLRFNGRAKELLNNKLQTLNKEKHYEKH